jgi:hypothetical protein
MVPVRRVGNADRFTLPERHRAIFQTAGWLVDSEPRFLYSCDTRAAKERGTTPESTNHNVTQTLACS